MARKADISRRTAETRITVKLDLDGTGMASVSTGVGFFDHMLEHLAFHGMVDLDVQAAGDLDVDQHHTVEDVAACLGAAFAEALGDKAGLTRYGSARVPMDDALAEVTIDFSGRPAVVWQVSFVSHRIGDFDTQLVEEFFRRFAAAAGMNLHVDVPYGINDHHIAEAVFKAAARAIRIAKSPDPDRGTDVPSTKGAL